MEYTFREVDFCDLLELEKPDTISFEKCEFKKVSFSKTIFKNVNFKECKFIETTFSLSTFIDCEFRDCEFKKIGISGNTTIFQNCYIDPEKLLHNVYVNEDKELLKEKGTTPFYQNYRSIKTRSEIARKIMTMRPVVNDLSMLITSIKVARNYETKSSIRGAFYHILTETFFKKVKYIFGFLFSIVEIIIINIFGWLTGWGYKIGKTSCLGGIGIVIFSLLYSFILFPDASYFNNLLKSIEYWFLIGYTKYPFADLSLWKQWTVFLNSFFGSLWFASLIPVVFNKMSRDDK